MSIYLRQESSKILSSDDLFNLKKYIRKHSARVSFKFVSLKKIMS